MNYEPYCNQCGGTGIIGIGTPCPSCNLQSPLTPPRGEPMPQTREYWEKRAAMDLELIMEMKEEISKLKHTVNQLRQKVKS